MKNFKTLLFCALAVSFISLNSCEVFEEEATEAVCNIDSEYNSYLNSVTTFSNNPTRTNCNNMLCIMRKNEIKYSNLEKLKKSIRLDCKLNSV